MPLQIGEGLGDDPRISSAGALSSVFRGRNAVSEWHYAQEDRLEELTELRFFTMKKRQPDGEVQFRITVKEFATPPPGQYVRFFAEADKPVNQKTAPIIPSGWGDSVLKALADCMRMIRQFPYEGEQRD
jgi:hypothetical protein